MTSLTIFNKSLNILAFDEIISIDTNFESNTYSNSINENSILINYLIKSNCVTKFATIELLEQLYKVIKLPQQKKPKLVLFVIPYLLIAP